MPCIMMYSLQGARNTAAFPPEVIEAYKYTFSQPGALTAAINYHRCIFSQVFNQRVQPRQLIEVPSLIIWVCMYYVQTVPFNIFRGSITMYVQCIWPNSNWRAGSHYRQIAPSPQQQAYSISTPTIAV